jgi:hypothetical protein
MLLRITAALACLVGFTIGCVVCCPSALAQTGLGTVTGVTQMSCAALYTPSNVYPNSYRNFDTTMTNCYGATISGCPNGVSDLAFVFGYAPPTAGVKPLGTIVMLSGDGGVIAAGTDFHNYITAYEAAGYQVVEVAWGPVPGAGIPWELANYTSPSTTPSILNAACRPATFLNWVRNGNSGVGNGIWGTYGGGMCAHANSGGAGAVAYALAWYSAGVGGSPTNGGGYLDKVVLENGPVFSDIDLGCNITCPNGVCGDSNATQICTATINGQQNEQTGCNNWNVSTAYSLEYVDGDQSNVNYWSGGPNPSCANNAVATNYGPTWAAMSIVDGSSGTQTPSFNYPNTGMSAWLCETSQVGLNNSGSQGEEFYLKFTAQSQAGGYMSVNGVNGCVSSPEDVEDGTVYIAGQGPYSGLTAIENDMIGNAPANPAASCGILGIARPSAQ